MVTIDSKNCVDKYGDFLDACVPAVVFLVSVHWYPHTVDVFHVLRLSGVAIPVVMSVLEVSDVMMFPGYIQVTVNFCYGCCVAASVLYSSYDETNYVPKLLFSLTTY
jgi:hypothetical protein